MSHKPTIVISSCLLGEPVRYDGGDKRQPELQQFLASRCNLVSLCPEMEMGLGVPRAPIQVVIVGRQYHLRSVVEPDTDYTRIAEETARKALQKIGNIDGWIFKARSPSCGLTDTAMFDTDGQEVAKGSGLFAKHVITAMPWLPCTTELQLESETEQKRFYEKCKILTSINHWLNSDRSEQSLLQMQQILKPQLPFLAAEDFHIFNNKSDSTDERFYQFRNEVMVLVNSL